MKRSITVQIGNSDNKLSQQGWSRFCKELNEKIGGNRFGETHFSGGSACESPWQNYCLVIELNEDVIERSIEKALTNLSERFDQDSIAYCIGSQKFSR